MLGEKKKNMFLKVSGLAVVAFALIYYPIIPPPPVDVIKDIEVIVVPPTKGSVDASKINPDVTLPDISKYPLRINNSTSRYIEIFSSPEKAGSSTDGWLTEVARDFNNAKIKIDGKQVSVRLRGIASGQGADYITSGEYLPDAYTPSNELWGEILISQGVDANLVQKRLAGNVAGILITKSKKDDMEAKYGAVNTTTIVEAVTNNELQMGYTNPFASSTGLNFLISALRAIDADDPLSNRAIERFDRFQANVPVVAYTTIQFREMVKSGVLDAFVLEYQTYVKTPDIRSYEFIPFGVRHDSPIYAIGKLSLEKEKILDEFIAFSQQEKYQKLATKYGFNNFEGYQSEFELHSGDGLIQAQKLWETTGNAKICAVFVVDVSGSMDGEPLNNLKNFLLEGQKSINEVNLIGLVSYSDHVYINLPISRFDLNNRSYFVGAVEGLQAGGGTATFDGIAIAMKMLKDQMALDPNLMPRIFVLSDGETTRGHSLNDIRRFIEETGIPIYTIGYNANIEKLEEISRINDAPSINGDIEDVFFELTDLVQCKP